MALLLLTIAPAWAEPPAAKPAAHDRTTTTTTTAAAVRFKDQAPETVAWYALKLQTIDSVSLGRFWWRGRLDASLAIAFGFTSSSLLLDGEFLDNLPFIQPSELPHRPANWGPTYIADGLEMVLEDPTTNTRRLRVMLNFGPGAIRPRIDILETDLEGQPRLLLQPNPAPWGTIARSPVARPCAGCDIQLFDGVVPEDGDIPPVRFQIAIPAAALTDKAWLETAWQATVRLHDFDLHPGRIKILEETVQTPGGLDRAAPGSPLPNGRPAPVRGRAGQ